MSGPKPPDILRIVEALDRRSVEYLLVGGIAATAHGAERLTGDADTVVRRTTENLEATAAVLRDLNAHLLVEGLSDDEAPELPVQIDALTLSRMEISTWRTDAGDLDVLVEIPAQDGSRLSYDDLLPRGRRCSLRSGSHRCPHRRARGHHCVQTVGQSPQRSRRASRTTATA